MRGTKVHKQIQENIITKLVCIVISVFLHIVLSMFKFEEQGWQGGARKKNYFFSVQVGSCTSGSW